MRARRSSSSCNPAVLRPEERLLFACTQQDFREQHRQAVLTLASQHAIDWGLVLETAAVHGVLPLVYANLRTMAVPELGIPPDLLAHGKQALVKNIVSKQYIRQRLVDATAFFRARAIDVMVIKGAALDLLYYDPPWYTESDDVDLVLRVARDSLRPGEHQEFLRELSDVGIEFDYFTHHDVVMNGVFPVDFCQIWRDARQTHVGEQEVYVMGPADQLIALCINSGRKRFFRLKTLCDIATTVRSDSALDWDVLVQKAKDYDCHAVVYTALWVTHMTVGCDVPAHVLDNLGVSQMRAKLIRWLAQRQSLRAYASLQAANRIRGRALDWSLLLPYATLRGYQVLRRIRHVYVTMR